MKELYPDLLEEDGMAKVAGEKPLSQAIAERRATPSFEHVPIHALEMATWMRC